MFYDNQENILMFEIINKAFFHYILALLGYFDLNSS